MGPAEIAFQVFFPDFLWVVFFLCALAVVALILGGVWMYRDAQSRHMDATVWLILLIVATIFGSLIGFLVVLLIYVVARGDHPVGGAMPYGYGYGPPGIPPGTPPPAGAPAAPAVCPACGNPMIWYPQYARWYCPTCAQYR
ncbi:MAG TPA: hypothetical protein VFA17_08560 [Thermoplasmata archaeon]|nr:hypothetical protein [Thermoplasmata archaeon]